MSDTPTLATTNATPSAPAQQPAPAVAKPVPGSKEFAALTTEQRHEQLRGPPNPRAEGHSPKRDQMEAAAARAAGEPDPTAAPADAAPANAQKFKVGKFEVSEDEIAAMMDRQAA